MTVLGLIEFASIYASASFPEATFLLPPYYPLTIPLLSSTLKVAFWPLFCIMIHLSSAYYYRLLFCLNSRILFIRL